MLSYLYETKIPSTGYEFISGYFRNERVFINDCAAGPGCTMLKQSKNRINLTKDDKLSNINIKKNLAEYISMHSRITKGNIKLYHFWFKI